MKTSNVTVAVTALLAAISIGTIGAPVTLVLGTVAICGAEILHYEFNKIPKRA